MSSLAQMLEMFLSRTGENTVKGTILPNGNNLYDLGSASKKFRKVYVDELVGTSVIGTHNHQADAGGGVLDHGLALTGLGDDDHTQYLNAARHTADPHTMTIDGVDVSAHAVANTGVHGIGASTFATAATLATAISDHAALITGVHGVGASTVASAADIVTHAGVKTGIHGLANAGGYTLTIPATGTAALLGTANVFSANQRINARLGLNCDADAQFDIDATGSIRAQGYLVGKHAIQLPDALLIAHYDGAMPYETDYTGNPTGHRGQVATVSGGVIYRPGKFGKSVQIAEAVTNVVLNPVGGAAGNVAALGLATVTLQSTEKYWIHSTSAKVVTTAAANDGVVYTLSALANAIHYVTTRIDAAWTTQQWSLDNVNWSAPTLLATGSDGWYTYGYSFPAVQANGSTGLRIRQSDATARTVYLGHVQVEQRAYPTPPCHGAMGTGHSWSGTAHASTSSRVAATLSYARTTSNINPAVGTISLWVTLPVDITADGLGHYILATDDWVNYWVIGKTAPNTWHVYVNTTQSTPVFAAGELVAGVPTHVALTWSSGRAQFYVNGVLRSDFAATLGAIAGSNLQVGCYINGTSVLNGYVDDLVILNRAASAVEVRAIYESNAPVFAETSTWAWRTPATNVWGDSLGLWCQDASGNPAFGVASVAKTWGGFSMDPGDVVIGNNVAGSGAAWWDASAKKLIFRGGGSATDQVYIDVDGTLKAGGGKFSVGATGITLVDDAAIFYYGANRFLHVLASSGVAGEENAFFGASAGNRTMTAVAKFNLGLGAQALCANTTGASNVAIGTTALFSNTTGTANVAIGLQPLYSNLVGRWNVAVGGTALYHAAGDSNTAIGDSAFFTTLGTGNVGLGQGAGYYETGSNKLFIDNAARASEADGRVKALIYGVFAATVAGQSLDFNAGAVTCGGTLKAVGAFGCNTKTPQTAYAVGAAATDLATVITLANNLRTMAINNGMAS